MIINRNNKWYLYSKDGSKKLGGPYSSRKQAVKRERQVQYFKHLKQASFKDEFKKLGVAVDFTQHFWDRAFSRPRVKNDINKVEYLFRSIGGGKDIDIEDIPELQYLLNIPNKKYVYQESPSKAKYIFTIKENPITKKHRFVIVTGLKPEYNSNNLEDITPIINQLLNKN